jgi:hypothetical protein
MTEIHILPTRPQSADQITRLRAGLDAAQEQGVDLGSRVAHIHANGETLLALSRKLEQAHGEMRQALSHFGVQDQLEEAALRQLLDKVQQLVDYAKLYPSST